jgi:acetyl-CoA carboxylase beta subunit
MTNLLSTSSIPIIFANDTSVIVYNKNLDDFCVLSNKVLSHMSKYFSANKLSLNLDKTNVIKFITKSSPQYPLNIRYNNKIYKKWQKTRNSLAHKLKIN